MWGCVGWVLLVLGGFNVVDVPNQYPHCVEFELKLRIDNKKLKARVKTFEENEVAFEGLKSENKKLKNKLFSVLKNLLSDNLIDVLL